MQVSAPELLALQRVADLERPLAVLEAHLAALSSALQERDPSRIEQEAAALHRSLATAMGQFARATRQGPIPPPLRQRLMNAGAQVAAQREVLARATASLDRAIDVLLPAPAPGVYSAAGAAERQSSQGEMRG